MAGMMLGMMTGIKDAYVEASKRRATQTKAFKDKWDAEKKKAQGVLDADMANDANYKTLGETIVKQARLQNLVAKNEDLQFDDSGLIKIGRSYLIDNKMHSTSANDFAGNVTNVLKDVIKKGGKVNPFNTIVTTPEKTTTTSQEEQTESAFSSGLKSIVGGVAGELSPSYGAEVDQRNIVASTPEALKAVMARGSTPKDYGERITSSRSKLTLPQQKQFKSLVQDSLVLNLSEFLVATKDNFGTTISFETKNQGDEMIENARGNMLAIVDVLVNKNAFEAKEAGRAAQFIVGIIKEANDTTNYTGSLPTTLKNKLGEVLKYVSNTDDNTLYKEIQNMEGTEFYNKIIGEETTEEGESELNTGSEGVTELRLVDFTKILGEDKKPVFKSKNEFFKWFNSPESMKTNKNTYGLYRELKNRINEHIIKTPDGRVATVHTRLSPKNEMEVFKFAIDPEKGMYDDYIKTIRGRKLISG